MTDTPSHSRGPLRASPLLVGALLAGCATSSGKPSDGASTTSLAAQSVPCVPLETRPTEAAGEKPALPNQTRVCGVKSNVAFDVVVVAKPLEKPWSVEPLQG